ncbi:hypothetical protein SAICODRAFT_78591 [Saitoella complicata NRRL Y-17804]|uniref:uncharacterized protein n=1 Tax=Saitoella complicata (strain BCRC 22490 / CBS 7301 / JCM 7358 / NBRC 10748 / NRRL Y-17804) TaxID=698492 RepID=UPI00086780E4|nr:uncharacterized protein SAICODRAFT_78591 [Saitoella complicata NRRL Y-17804]ODQ54273.1 hypothetical protein SAICODRAFT_78591 [Saitoella complicata NRRL Y-17804]
MASESSAAQIPADFDVDEVVLDNDGFGWVKRVDARKPERELEQLIHDVVVVAGVPLVIENWHLREDFPKEMLSMQYLKNNLGDMKIPIRDMDRENVVDQTMSMSDYLSMIPTLAAENADLSNASRRRLYAKDLTCPDEWRDSVASLLPDSLVYLGSNDFMSKLPPSAQAENIMLYIGHEGTYTTAHRDMCAAVGHNLMVHTDPNSSSLWFMTSTHSHLAVKEKFPDIDLELHWATIDEWAELSENAKVYMCEQKEGDLMLVPTWAAHQVWNRGSATVKVSWNRVTADSLTRAVKAALPAYKAVCHAEEYKIKSILHATINNLTLDPPHMSVQQITNLQTLFPVFTDVLTEEYLPDTSQVKRCEEKFRYSVRCSYCSCDIWNRFLTCTDCEGDPYDVCIECYARGRSCAHISGLKWMEQWDWEKLCALWMRARQIFNNVSEEDRRVETWDEQLHSRKTMAMVCEEENGQRPRNLENPRKTTRRCHPCKNTHEDANKQVTCARCDKIFCMSFLMWNMEMDPSLVLAGIWGRWECPACYGDCKCAVCLAKPREENSHRRLGDVPRPGTSPLAGTLSGWTSVNTRAYRDQRSRNYYFKVVKPRGRPKKKSTVTPSRKGRMDDVEEALIGQSEPPGPPSKRARQTVPDAELDLLPQGPEAAEMQPPLNTQRDVRPVFGNGANGDSRSTMSQGQAQESSPEIPDLPREIFFYSEGIVARENGNGVTHYPTHRAHLEIFRRGQMRSNFTSTVPERDELERLLRVYELLGNTEGQRIVKERLAERHIQLNLLAEAEELSADLLSVREQETVAKEAEKLAER